MNAWFATATALAIFASVTLIYMLVELPRISPDAFLTQRETTMTLALIVVSVASGTFSLWCYTRGLIAKKRMEEE